MQCVHSSEQLSLSNLILPQKARGVISSRNDSAYGIQSRIHSLFRVSSSHWYTVVPAALHNLFTSPSLSTTT